jgi:hypothetical protein
MATGNAKADVPIFEFRFPRTLHTRRCRARLPSRFTPSVTAMPRRYLAHGSEVDAQQHGHDHEPPDEHRYRNIDLGQAHVAQQVERPGHGTAERHACHDAQGNP